jgi:hypothetical protein
MNSEFPLSGNCQETSDTNWLDLSSIDSDIRIIIDRWKELPDVSRQKVLKLVESVSR